VKNKTKRLEITVVMDAPVHLDEEALFNEIMESVDWGVELAIKHGQYGIMGSVVTDHLLSHCREVCSCCDTDCGIRSSAKGFRRGDPVKLSAVESEDRGVIMGIDSDGIAYVVWDDGKTEHIHCSDIERSDKLDTDREKLMINKLRTDRGETA